MTNLIKISYNLDTIDPAFILGFESWIDNTKFFDSENIQTAQAISTEISDDSAEHELKFVLKNKNPRNTIVDESGNIIQDARLIISNLAFDDIELGHLLVKKAIYTHDFNGTRETTEEKFYGELGCNGVVSLKFTTPMYLWILENM